MFQIIKTIKSILVPKNKSNQSKKLITLDNYLKLNDSEKEDAVYKNGVSKEVYDYVKNQFTTEFGSYPKIYEIYVDDYGLPGIPLIIVYLYKGNKRLKFPKRFLGFGIYKIYTNKIKIINKQ
jgi:hypothetical protein